MNEEDESMTDNDVPEADEVVDAVEIPMEQLSEDVLRALVESYINREGTDYGAVERSLDEKVADVMRQLEDGSARILFDPETESISLATTD